MNQDCPSQEEAHPAWRNGVILADDDTGEALIEYLCVSVEVAPLDVVYDKISLDRSLVFGIEPVDDDYNDVNLSELTFEWGHADGEFRPNLASTIPPDSLDTSSDWSYQTIPLLKVQVSIVNLDQKFDRAMLNSNTRVFFLYPHAAAGGDRDWRTAPGDELVGGDCDPNDLFACKVTFDLPPPNDAALDYTSGAGQPSDQLIYAVRIQSFYNEARLRITGRHGSLPREDAQFKNLQAVITATGRSGNVLERLRERIPLRPIYDLPEYALDSAGDLCKILAATDSAGAYLFDGEGYELLASEPACSLTP